MTATLFICPFSPASNGPQAGHRLAFEYIRDLAKTAHVDVVLLLNSKEWPSDELYALEQVRVIKVFRFSKIERLWGLIRSRRKFAPRFATRSSSAAFAFIAERLASGEYSTLRCEFSQTFTYAPVAKRFPGMRVVLGVHDIQTQLVLRKSYVESLLFTRETYDLEQYFLGIADEIRVLSDKDYNLIRSLFFLTADVTIQSIPLSGFVSAVARTSSSIERGTLLFWGAMNRTENEHAALAFIEDCFLPLRTLYPFLRLFIVGSGPSEKLCRYQSSYITVTGFVENPQPYFERAEIGVVPLTQGAGIKLKTLEMLACGLPVVSTHIGAEGIPLTTSQLTVLPAEDFFGHLKAYFGANR